MKTLLLLMVVSGLLMPSAAVLASCAETTPAAQFESAELVADATVIGFWPWGPVRLRIDRYYKSPSSADRTLTIRRANSQSTSVDVTWESGQRYLIYLRKTAGQWTTSICDGTVVWEQRPSMIDGRTSEPPSSSSTQTYVLAAAAVLIVGGGMWLVRQKRVAKNRTPVT